MTYQIAPATLTLVFLSLRILPTISMYQHTSLFTRSYSGLGAAPFIQTYSQSKVGVFREVSFSNYNYWGHFVQREIFSSSQGWRGAEFFTKVQGKGYNVSVFFTTTANFRNMFML